VKLLQAQHERLAFLCRITQKEIKHLLDTDRRLFADLFTIEAAQKIETDPILAERLDAFVSRFGRLQDNIGDKFLPQLLMAVAEKPGAAIDNLDRAERLGWIESAETWLEIRKLRNQMVHEYIEDLAILTSALQAGHKNVSTLVKAGEAMIAKATQLMTP
jgi:methanogenic corrinoid protein MtbC1